MSAFRLKDRVLKSPAQVPVGMRVYAVGDLHGRRDLLDALLERIVADAREAPPGTVNTIVYMGDYVDRGPDSRGVIERVAGDPPPGFGVIALRGNHEDAMLGFLADPARGRGWLSIGGLATLASYGVSVDLNRVGDVATTLVAEMKQRMPRHHRAFLTDLQSSFVLGDYMFVHAGIRPGVPLEDQKIEDMLWIREPFLKSRRDHGKVVVHGHTISDEPDIHDNRIGIDTGAFASGRLTCLVLEDKTLRFLQTSP